MIKVLYDVFIDCFKLCGFAGELQKDGAVGSCEVCCGPYLPTRSFDPSPFRESQSLLLFLTLSI